MSRRIPMTPIALLSESRRGEPFAAEAAAGASLARRVLAGGFRTFLATAFLQETFGRCLEDARSLCGFLPPEASARPGCGRTERRRSRTDRAVGYTTAAVLKTAWATG